VEITSGQLLRDARRRHGVSQARLAIRAGTTQSAISRIERDQVSPSVETLQNLLHLLGEDLELRGVGRDSGIDRSMVHERLSRPPADRVDYGLAFACFAIETRRANEPDKSAA
jgi:transcriptional regulator with XRE-family HTH domain